MTMTEIPVQRVTGYSHRMTEAAFEKWALKENVRAEWVNGEVIVMAPVSEEHFEIVHWLQTLLGLYVAKRKLGRVVPGDFMVRLPERRRMPDVFFVATGSRARFSRTHLQGGPDLAVEIVSPDSESRDWRDKYLEYQEAGVREYWVIDPASEHAEFYALKRGKYVPMGVKEGVLRSIAVAGFWIKVEWLWQHPAPNVYELAQEIGII
jgi:Uma2 family endonuclease